MKPLEKNIFFHVDALKKVSILSNEILKELQGKNVDLALDMIQNRERLLNIVFKLHEAIESDISQLTSTPDEEIKFYKAWAQDVNNWSQEQSQKNDQIEELLMMIKAETTMEIASIFDKKSRHKGYDLNNLK